MNWIKCWVFAIAALGCSHSVAEVEVDERAATMTPPADEVVLVDRGEFGEPERFACTAHTGQPGNISAEGELWFYDGVQLQRVSPAREVQAVTFDGAVKYLLPGPKGLVVVTESRTFALRNGAEELAVIDLPFASPDALCGDLLGSSPVLARKGPEIFERRDGIWWRWNGAETRLRSDDAFASLQNDCGGSTGVAWLFGEGRALELDFGAEGSAVARRPRQEVTQVARLSEDELALVSNGELVVESSSRSQRYRFDGDVTKVAAAGNELWVSVAGDLYRRNIEGDFPRISSPVAHLDEILVSDSGVLWVIGDGQRCYLETSPRLALVGLTSFQRLTEGSHEVTVDLRGAETVSIALNDELVAEDLGFGERVALQFDRSGWHRVSLHALESSREILVEVIDPAEVSWAEDVRPIHDSTCSGCHSDDTILGLRDYESWRVYSETILDRVARREMPPAGGKELSEEEISTIVRWVEGGALP